MVVTYHLFTIFAEIFDYELGRNICTMVRYSASLGQR